MKLVSRRNPVKSGIQPGIFRSLKTKFGADEGGIAEKRCQTVRRASFAQCFNPSDDQFAFWPKIPAVDLLPHQSFGFGGNIDTQA
jgi:hypothetical protein